MTENRDNLFNPEGVGRHDDITTAMGGTPAHRHIRPGVDYIPQAGERKLHVDTPIPMASPVPPVEAEEPPTQFTMPPVEDIEEPQPVTIYGTDESVFDEQGRLRAGYVTGSVDSVSYAENADDEYDYDDDPTKSRKAIVGLTALVAGGLVASYYGLVNFGVIPNPLDSDQSREASSQVKTVPDNKSAPKPAKDQSPSASVEPTPEISPSVEPTPTPEATPTPEPTPTPEATPSVEPTEAVPTPVPTETVPVVPPTEVRVATFNIYHSDDQPAEVWKDDRLRKTTNLLKGLSPDANWQDPIDPALAVGVAGLQEVRPNQQAAFLKDNFGGKIFDMYPRIDRDEYFTPNPIIWQRDLFDLVRTDSVQFYYFGGEMQKAPIVLLQSKLTGEQFWVMNAHYPADVRGDASELRHQNDRIFRDKATGLQKNGTPVIFTVDANNRDKISDSSFNEPQDNEARNLSTCYVPATGALEHSLRTFVFPEGEEKACGEEAPGLNSVDKIFNSPQFDVIGYSYDNKPPVNGSDAHRLHIAHLVLPVSEVVQPTEVVTEPPVVEEVK